MNQQNNQEYGNNGFLDGIQNEVSAESAPLLQFIVKYAGVIAGAVIVMLAVPGAMGIWNWHQDGRQKEIREQLAAINLAKDSTNESAISKLAENAPDSLKQLVYMNLGQAAQKNGNFKLAEDTFKKAAEANRDNAFGFVAALANAASLLNRKQYDEAIEILTSLKNYAGENSILLQEMLAEAYAEAGKKEQAAKAYEWLAKEVKSSDADYFNARAKHFSSLK